MNIDTRETLRAVLDEITFGPSGVMLDKMDLRWEIEEVVVCTTAATAWLIRFTFNRPDTVTGEMGRGAGRWELVAKGTSRTSVVKTCWLLLELLVRHELMEAFLYQGSRLFDPHKTVEQLRGSSA